MARPKKTTTMEQEEEMHIDPTEWFILQGFSFEGNIYNRGEKVPDKMPEHVLNNLYERKYIGKLTSDGIAVCNHPVDLSDAEIHGVQTMAPPVLKHYLTYRNISKESLQKLVKANRLIPPALEVVLERLTALEKSEEV